ncbi:hypothetical protein [Helicobacter sp. MIT 14-3879]|uniref:hypothetical protein n=1 Tax=Helicobacter sp. MIT 14-3879 TaxID=2040649 RepID=UPI000E1F9E54|nr:hypothetical protein [Helicobacter sp. MIT 14-3879]RDU61602.1 hypothetical protein CQA44_08490 [Helicobacter sp. MIT 14-3879]
MPSLAFTLNVLLLFCLLSVNAQDSLYNTQPTDSSLQDSLVDSLDTQTPLSDKEQKQMQIQQMDLMRKEQRSNPAPSDLIYYKQREIQKEIQKDSTLKIDPSRLIEVEQMGESIWYEFVIFYILKLVNDTPYGESYKISVPLVSKLHKKEVVKTCEIPTKETYYSLTIYPYYTESEMQASIKKQTQQVLYNFLQKYKHNVLECLMQHGAYIDDMNTAINLESRTKTLANVRSYLIVRFSGGILTLKILEMQANAHQK